MSFLKKTNQQLKIIFNLFYDENQPNNLVKKSSKDEIRSIRRLNVLFVFVLSIDMIARGFMSEWYLMSSSIFLVISLLISRIYIKQDKLEKASLIIALSFYVIAVYQNYFLQTLYVPYFILLLTPVLAGIIMRSLRTKFMLFGLSIVLFMVCNHLVGEHLFANNLFFIGLIPGFFTMIYFYNKSKILEEEREELIYQLKEKNDEMLLFSQMMGHDLKAPLRSIKGFSALLKKALNKNENSTETEKEYLQFILDNADNMDVLVQSLLTYMKASSSDYMFEEVDLDQLIEAQKLTFQLDINQGNLIIEKSELGTITANRNALKTVFQNLFSNAIKYQPLNKANHIPKISIILESQVDEYHILFKDNGIGIKEEYIENVFTPFRRFHSVKEYTGTGLGLSVCKKILNKHNGDISIHNSNEKGTSFLIKIPKQN